MAKYDVGYGKPPRKSRFKPGVSGNPKGRPKRKPSALAEIIQGVLAAPITYRDKGRVRAISRHELCLKTILEHAIKGSLDAAELVLKIRAHAQRFGDVGFANLQISDWLPDYPGQTAEQKTHDFADTIYANALDKGINPDERSGESDRS